MATTNPFGKSSSSSPFNKTSSSSSGSSSSGGQSVVNWDTGVSTDTGTGQTWTGSGSSSTYSGGGSSTPTPSPVILTGGYVPGVGFVTSTGQTYPTTNPNFVPSGYTSTTGTNNIYIQGGKVIDPTGGQFVGNVVVPGSGGLTANQILANQLKQAGQMGYTPSQWNKLTSQMGVPIKEIVKQGGEVGLYNNQNVLTGVESKFFQQSLSPIAYTQKTESIPIKGAYNIFTKEFNSNNLELKPGVVIAYKNPITGEIFQTQSELNKYLSDNQLLQEGKKISSLEEFKEYLKPTLFSYNDLQNISHSSFSGNLKSIFDKIMVGVGDKIVTYQSDSLTKQLNTFIRMENIMNKKNIPYIQPRQLDNIMRDTNKQLIKVGLGYLNKGIDILNDEIITQMSQYSAKNINRYIKKVEREKQISIKPIDSKVLEPGIRQLYADVIQYSGTIGASVIGITGSILGPATLNLSTLASVAVGSALKSTTGYISEVVRTDNKADWDKLQSDFAYDFFTGGLQAFPYAGPKKIVSGAGWVPIVKNVAGKAFYTYTILEKFQAPAFEMGLIQKPREIFEKYEAKKIQDIGESNSKFEKAVNWLQGGVAGASGRILFPKTKKENVENLVIGTLLGPSLSWMKPVQSAFLYGVAPVMGATSIIKAERPSDIILGSLALLPLGGKVWSDVIAPKLDGKSITLSPEMKVLRDKYGEKAVLEASFQFLKTQELTYGNYRLSRVKDLPNDPKLHRTIEKWMIENDVAGYGTTGIETLKINGEQVTFLKRPPGDFEMASINLKGTMPELLKLSKNLFETIEASGYKGAKLVGTAIQFEGKGGHGINFQRFDSTNLERFHPELKFNDLSNPSVRAKYVKKTPNGNNVIDPLAIAYNKVFDLLKTGTKEKLIKDQTPERAKELLELATVGKKVFVRYPKDVTGALTVAKVGIESAYKKYTDFSEPQLPGFQEFRAWQVSQLKAQLEPYLPKLEVPEAKIEPYYYTGPVPSGSKYFKSYTVEMAGNLLKEGLEFEKRILKSKKGSFSLTRMPERGIYKPSKVKLPVEQNLEIYQKGWEIKLPKFPKIDTDFYTKEFLYPKPIYKQDIKPVKIPSYKQTLYPKNSVLNPQYYPPLLQDLYPELKPQSYTQRVTPQVYPDYKPQPYPKFKIPAYPTQQYPPTNQIKLPIKSQPQDVFPISPFRRKEKKQEKQIEPGYNTFVKSLQTKQFKQVNTIPLTKTRAMDLGSFIVDQGVTRTYKIKLAGRKAQVDYSLDYIPVGYAQATSNKFRPYKIKQGQPIDIGIQFIEKNLGTIDTKREKEQLAYFRRLEKQIMK